MLRTIGTDIDLQECIASGYLMLRFDDTIPLTDQELYFIQTLAEDCRSKKQKVSESTKQSYITVQSIREQYLKHKTVYDNFGGITQELDWNDPYCVLQLADTVNAYDGYIFW